PADPVYTLGTCPCFVSDTRRRIRAPCPCWTPCTGPSMPVAPDWHTACANTPAYSCDTVGTAAGLCPYICCCNTWRCHAGATCRHYSHPGGTFSMSDAPAEMTGRRKPKNHALPVRGASSLPLVSKSRRHV